MPDRVQLLPIAAPQPDARPANGEALARPAGDRQPLLLTAEDLAAELQVSLRSVRRLDLEGKLPEPVHVGGRLLRWRAAEVRDWVNAGCPRRDRWTWQPAEN